MKTSAPIVFAAALRRKDPRLPVYVVVPHAQVAHWKLQGTTMVEGAIDGRPFGRRSMKRMNATSHSDWFVEFTAPICKALGVKVGDEVTVSLQMASTEIPKELEDMFSRSPSIRESSNSLSEYARRTSAEHVRDGKSEPTRLRRAEAIAKKLGAGRGT